MSVKTQWEMACPKCGSDESIDIAATVWVRLTEDGTDADEAREGSHEWDNDSLCVCGKCGFAGTVRDFEADPPDEEEREAGDEDPWEVFQAIQRGERQAGEANK